MAIARIQIVVEFKEWRIDAGEMDKVIGAAIRARGRFRPATLEDIYVYCRGYTAEAEARAKEIEAVENLRIRFQVINP